MSLECMITIYLYNNKFYWRLLIIYCYIQYIFYTECFTVKKGATRIIDVNNVNNKNCVVKSNFTAAKERAATERPNLRATESEMWAHRGSHVAQAAQSMQLVHNVSTNNACTVLIFGWITVMQRAAVEFGFPSLNNSTGVIICGNIDHRSRWVYSCTITIMKQQNNCTFKAPYPRVAPINCPRM